MRRICVPILSVLLLATPAAAQEDLLDSCAAIQPTSSASGAVPGAVADQFRFLCGQVVNVLANVQPTVGIGLSGGAHTLGTATTIGRRLGVFPRVSLTMRGNVAIADVPDLLDDYTPSFDGNGELSAMGTQGVPVWALQGDVTIGLFNGFGMGPTVGGLGAIDLLGSVSYVPTVDDVGGIDEIINAGIGARVGIVRQGLVMPGISVSGMYRTMLDDVSFGSIDEGDPAEFSSNLSTYSFRVGVSKGILLLDLAAGAGYDIYKSDVAFDWELDCPASECGQDVTLGTQSGVEGELSTAAWNVYGNVGLNFLLVNVVGEVGYQKATSIVDAASFSEAGLPAQAPTDEELEGGRFFASLGLRLTF
jgi:hypothetical protein